MTQDQATYLRKCVGSAAGDDLERAVTAFRHLSQEQLDGPYGQSGVSCREILDGYRKSRVTHQAAYAALDELLRGQGL